MRNHGLARYVWLCLLLGPAFATAQTLERPRLVVQLGHTSYLFDAAFSPDGRFLVTSSDDHTVKFWDAATGIELRSFDHGNQAISVEFSPDGKRLLTNGNGTKLWDVATGKLLREFRFTESHCLPYSATLTPDGRSVLVFGSCLIEGTNGLAELHDAETGALIRVYSHPEHTSARNAIFSPDGAWFVTYSFDNVACIWNTGSGKLVRTITGHGERIEAAAVSPDGQFVLTGSADATMRLWKAATGAEVRRFTGHSGGVDAVAFSPDGRSLVSGGGNDGAVRLWNTATGVETRQFGKSTNGVYAVVFSPDGRTLLVVRGRVPILWDVATGAEAMRFAGYSDWVFGMAMSPDGRYLAAGCGPSLVLWDLSTGMRVRRFTGHTSLISSVAFSLDGTRLLTGAWDKTARLWDTATGVEVRRFDDHPGGVLAVAISPDGKYIATYADGGTARLWDAATGAAIATIASRSTEEFPQTVAFSPDGRQLLVGMGGREGACQIHAIPSGALVRSFKIPGDVASVGMTSDGRMAYAATSSRVWFWDAQTGAVLEQYEKVDGHGLHAASISPDGRYLLVGGGAYLTNSFPGVPALYDRTTRKKVRAFEGHTNLVNTVAWAGGGRFVVTGSKDCTVRIWDPATGRELCRLISFNDGTWVTVDPDGRFDTNNLERIPGLHWTMPGDPLIPLPVEIFLREYYEPRLLARILSGERFAPVRPLSSLNRVQPKVRILDVTPSPGAVDRVDVRVEVRDAVRGTQRSGVYDVRVFRDGQLAGAAPEAGGKVTLNGATGTKTLTFPGIRLPRSAAGSNVVFSAYAFNSDRVKSLTARKAIPVPAGGEPPVRRAYVVSVGVNASEDRALNLRFAANDARRTNAVLVERLTRSGRFAGIVPVVLASDIGSESLASKANIRAVLDRLAGRPVDAARLAAIPGGSLLRPAEPDDLVMLSFAGHGYADGLGAFYLVPYDVGAGARASIAAVGMGRGSTSPGGVLSRCISSEELGQWLRDVDAGDITLIVDACQSAALTGENFKPGPMGSRGLGQLAYDKGMRILAATQADNVALELQSLQQGLLTYALVVNGLEGGEADFQPKDGVIGLAEWLQYAVGRVPELFGEMQSGRVRPASGGEAPRILIQGPAPAIQEPALFDFARRKDEVGLGGSGR